MQTHAACTANQAFMEEGQPRQFVWGRQHSPRQLPECLLQGGQRQENSGGLEDILKPGAV